MAEKPGTSYSSNLPISTSSGKEDQSSDEKDFEKDVRVGHSSEGAYRCNLCGDGFKDEMHKKQHERFHKLAYSVVCTCRKSFYSSTRLRQHVKSEHGQDEPFKCSYCASRFGNFQKYIQHLLDNHREEYDEICSSSLPDLGESSGESSTRKRKSTSKDDNQSPRKAFKQVPSNLKMFPCFLCKASFSDSNQLDHHISSIHTKGLFSCVKCKHSFCDDEDLDNHMSKFHISDIVFLQCLSCNLLFIDDKELKQHTINSHLPHSSDQYQCCICVYETNSLTDLQQHRRREHQFFHQCGECINVYLSDAEFRQHAYHHSLTRSLGCPCNAPFSDPVLLKEHCLKVHPDFEPFRCYLCSKFSCISDLASHLITNHGAFVCLACQRTFHTQLHLDNHFCANM